MPRTRLERSLILQAVQKQERRGKLRESVMKKLDAIREMKEAYRTLVKNLPAVQQEKAMLSLALRTSRTIAPPVPKQTQDAKVQSPAAIKDSGCVTPRSRSRPQPETLLPVCRHAVAAGAATAIAKRSIVRVRVRQPHTRLRREDCAPPPFPQTPKRVRLVRPSVPLVLRKRVPQ